MGDFNVRAVLNSEDRSQVYNQILDDITALDAMISNGMIDEGPAKIGAEQEICLVDSNYRPQQTALSILDNINDDHYTNELALYNLELNLDPHDLHSNCFSATESDLVKLLQKGRMAAANFDSQLLLCGILPTLKFRHLEFECMTPIERYRTLSTKLAELRGSEFEIYVQGIDDLIMSLPTVLFEACNTSFQLHLQINPNNFVPRYNWSQMIAGPVLSACVNSPILFGRELWAETRIAIFKQSLDTRSSINQMRRKLSRVYFGNQWLTGSPSQLLKEQVIRFPVIATSDNFENATSVLKNGGIPNLRAVLLHNGTTYTWNRFCYGTQGAKPHFRIECRYLPAGPTPIDEIANFAFWIGLMRAMPEDWNSQFMNYDFQLVKNNFLKAARYGLDSIFNWFGETIPAKYLILDQLLPMAANGLRKSNVDEKDIDKYLGIIEKRVQSERTGSRWMTSSYRILQRKCKRSQSLRELTARSIEYQTFNIPVHNWEIPSSCISTLASLDHKLVDEVMTTDMFCVRDDHEISFATSILSWQPFHHLPVENHEGDLVGMITDGLLKRHRESGNQELLQVKDIMIKDLVSLTTQDSVSRATEIMDSNDMSGLPVTFNNKLVGIVTRNDLK